MDETRSDHSVRAASDLALLRLGQADFAHLLDAHPELGGYFAHYAAETSIRYFLECCTLFAPLSPQEIRGLLACLQARDYAAGQFIYREGEPGDGLYILRRGGVRVVQESQRGKLINHINPGEAFGLTALLTGKPRATSAVAKEPSSVFRLEKSDFDQLVAASPAFKEALVNLAAGYPETGVRSTAPLSRLTGMLVPPTGALVAPTGALVRQTAKLAAPTGPLPPAPETVETNGYHPPHARRYPALLQLSETDCGAACLAMILRYYKKHVSINRLRELANVGREGATLYSVAEAAEALGFHARGIRASFEHLAKLALPAVAHWEGFHYIVLYEAKRDHVVVADPALGLRRLSREEFEKGWTGYALLVEPTPKLAGVEESKTTFGRFLPLFRPARRLQRAHWQRDAPAAECDRAVE